VIEDNKLGGGIGRNIFTESGKKKDMGGIDKK
jgi:hypothetical protein